MGLDVAALAQVFVQEATLGGGHRPKRDLAALTEHEIGNAIGLGSQRVLAALAVARRVDDDPGTAGPAQDDALRKMLDRLDNRSVGPDERLGSDRKSVV